MRVDLRLDRCVHHETVARAGTSKYGTFGFEGGGGWGGGAQCHGTCHFGENSSSSKKQPAQNNSQLNKGATYFCGRSISSKLLINTCTSTWWSFLIVLFFPFSTSSVESPRNVSSKLSSSFPSFLVVNKSDDLFSFVSMFLFIVCLAMNAFEAEQLHSSAWAIFV